MRAFAVALLLAFLAWSYTIVNTCNAPQSYVDSVKFYLDLAYKYYCDDIKCPALCPDFYVELTNGINAGGLAYSRLGPTGACTYKIALRCDLGSWLAHIVFHEMAHALQSGYAVDFSRGYGWWTEAHAEGITTYYMVYRIYKAGEWWGYGWVKYFFSESLYEKDPWKCTAPDLCAYKYGAFYAWLSWRYGPLNATQVYASDMQAMRSAYHRFLLSPWSWGREPQYNDFYDCRYVQMASNTGVYCRLDGFGVYTISANQLINWTVRDGSILLAFVAPYSSTLDPTVTVTNCPSCNPTVTVTTTYTTTYTTTTTVPVTVTYTTTYTTEITKTVTTTVPVTTTYTTTIPVTYTTTITSPVPVTTTYTTTVTTTVPYTTTVTTTIPITYTVTYVSPTTTTVTYVVNRTVTVPITYTTTVNRTVTTTEYVERTSVELIVMVAIVALLIGCALCGSFSRRAQSET